MKRTILTYGIISGLVITLLMASTLPFASKESMSFGMAIGFTTMIIALSFIFFAISSYKKRHGLKAISFGQAFRIGILISIICSLFYVVTWMIMYKFFMPDFMSEYLAYQVAEMRESGATEAQIQKVVTNHKIMEIKYQNPLYRAAITFMEIFPVGMLMTLIAAFVEMMRQKKFGKAIANPQAQNIL